MSPNKEAVRNVLSPRTIKFLERFHGRLIVYLGEADPSLPPITSTLLAPERNEEGYGVFFTVNGFDPKEKKRDLEHLVFVNGFFVDVDFPKNKTDLNDIALKNFKYGVMQEITEFSLAPTAIVETKNGYHIYWLLEQPINYLALTPEQKVALQNEHRAVEEAIIKRFNGDAQAKDLSRILRVPELNHLKDPKNPYEVKLKFFNEEHVYTWDQIRKAFETTTSLEEWATASEDRTFSDEMKEHIERLYPKIDRPSFRSLLDKIKGAKEGERNHTLLIAASVARQAGWSEEKAMEYFDEYNGLNIREIQTTLRSAYGREKPYDFGYNNPIIAARVTEDERNRYREVCSKVLGTADLKNGEIFLTPAEQKTIYIRYEYKFIERHPEIKTQTNGLFYRYEGGVYHVVPILEMENIMLREMYMDGLTNYRKRSAISDKLMCLRSLPHVCFDTEEADKDKNILNVKNGLLNIRTGEIRPHTPDYISLSQIDAYYDPNFVPERFNRFLDEITLGDKQQQLLLQEMAGYCLTSDVSYHTAFILHGHGRNGKGVFARLLSRIVGREFVSSLTLKDLSSDFGLFDLHGKKLNLIDEVSSNYFESDTIKRLISGELITAKVKYRDSIQFYPSAKFIFSVNDLPRINDQSFGFYKRFIIIPFRASFAGREDRELEPTLARYELSGILNWAIAGLKRLQENKKFTIGETNDQAMSEFQYQNSPLVEFLQNFYNPLFSDDPLYGKAQIGLYDFYAEYKNFCIANGYRTKSVGSVGKEFEVLHNYTDYRVVVSKGRVFGLTKKALGALTPFNTA